ncbi:phage tail protein [Actinophytocola glycyrrhizae]|uniref:Phage tail protein n=1 Tax=Actinophytocola glycyrrhizae TaxID=2044873 RepID=A0ABV9SBS7_9PSEU
MGDGKTQDQVISAPRFYIEFSHIGKIAFSELGGITTKVATQEYIYNNDKGETVHTKQYGKTEPPTITLKRGLDWDGNHKLMVWHAMSRRGDPAARSSGTLIVSDASGKNEITYVINGGWCSELQVTSMKAGDSAVAMIECKITCEDIEVPESGLL